MRPHFRFEDLEIWQLAVDMAVKLHRLADRLDAKKMYRYAGFAASRFAICPWHSRSAPVWLRPFALTSLLFAAPLAPSRGADCIPEPTP